MKYTAFIFLTIVLIMSCDLADTGLNSGGTVSGSITKFKIIKDFLYVIDGTDLRLLSIADPTHPTDLGSVEIGFGPETLFHLGDILFVGAQTGMYIFSITDPARPDLLSHYEHVLNCDPVVANTERAYVTLRAGGNCRGVGISAANELHVIDISDKRSPTLLSAQRMQHPRGLGLDGNLLFVCDGDRGVVVYELNEEGLPVKDLSGIPGFEAIDVIAHDHLLIVITHDQILQFDYSDINQIKLLSAIEHGV
jgi:hypothetical protein